MREHERTAAMTPEWPSLRVGDWGPTRDTVHMWLQIVGKIRMAHAPLLNHWWQVTLYVSPRGLTTSTIPYGARVFDIELDFLDHRLLIRDYPVGPAEVYFSDEFRQFLLPYEAVRTAADPDRAVSEFLRTSYEAAAELGKWDRQALEDDPHRLGVHRWGRGAGDPHPDRREPRPVV